jgi:hypothetical protein
MIAKPPHRLRYRVHPFDHEKVFSREYLAEPPSTKAF